MEVQNKLTRCPNCGGYYDAAVHASCPNCARGGSFGETTAPNGGAVFGTVDPAAGSNFGTTTPPNTPVNNTRPVTPASDGNAAQNMSETVIGGMIEAESYSGGVNPVCGWLVCIEGAEKGVDFRVHNGYNYIGREAGDIHISGDPQISREKHALIAYDNESNSYYFGPADGVNIVRLNGRAVMRAEEIHAYDVIKVGQTKLLFVPLCGDKFTWTEE